MKKVKKKPDSIWVAGKQVEVTPSAWEAYMKKPIAIKACRIDCKFMVDTMEGAMWGKAGDYLIQGIKGELYPCAKKVFELSYEREEND